MNLNELKVDELGIICYMDTNSTNIKEMYQLMSMGLVPGLEIRKLSQVSTCAEYRIEGVSARMVIDKCTADYIIVDRLDETIE